MIIMSWNIYGIAIDQSRIMFQRHCQAFRPDLVGIIEPRARISSIPASFWFSVNLWHICLNDRGNRRSNIWILAVQNLSISILLSSDQVVVVRCSLRSSYVILAFVHGSSDYIHRRRLWSDLSSYADLNALFLGDFNAIRGAFDKKGGGQPSASAVLDFNTFIDDNELLEIPTSGLKYSWCRRTPILIHSLLDRALASMGFLDFWSSVSALLLPRACSDHSPLVVTCLEASTDGPTSFHFFSMWTEHDSFLKLVESSWSASVLSSCSFRRLTAKLKRLKLELKVWNKEVFGNVNVPITDLEERLGMVQSAIVAQGYSDDLLDEEVCLQAELNSFLSLRNEMLRQKSRVDWLKDGDRNITFFHRCVKLKQTRSSISALRIDGELVSDLNRISDHLIKYFTDLFGPTLEAVDFECVSDLIPRLVTLEQADTLIAAPSIEEVRTAIFGVDSESAPGPDGYSGCFFQKTWSIVGMDVYAAVIQFFITSVMPTGINSSFVMLLPKTEAALEAVDFKPIIMSNFIFKVISKIIATRLNAVASVIISSQQFGFISGRKIHDAITLASEGVNCLFRSSGSKNMAFKVDIRKAFDTLRWDFMQHVLSCFGFPSVFCTWIASIFSSARLSILINGSPKGYFQCHRGVRQGDPISPILFGLAEDVLSRMLSRAVDLKQLVPMSYCHGVCFLSHILYADDVLLFCKATTGNCVTISQIFSKYATMSGQHYNPTKSRVYYGEAVFPLVRAAVRAQLGFIVGSFPLNYLGVPLFRGVPRYRHILPLADRIVTKFDKWTGRHLSMAGRLCLVKSVISSSAVHSMMIYKWSSSLTTRLDKVCRNFIWSGDPKKVCRTVVKWDRACADKAEGGIGLNSFTLINDSLLMSLAWKLLRNETPSLSVVRRRLFTPKMMELYRTASSSVWPGLRPIVLTLRDNSFSIVGCGAATTFLTDNWLGYRLVDRLQVPKHMHCLFSERVSDYYANGIWSFTTFFVEMHPNIIMDILHVPVAVDLADDRVWMSSMMGDVTPAIAKMHLKPRYPIVKWGSWIWDSLIPVRRSLVVWRLLHARLPTLDFIGRHGFVEPNCCFLCQQNAESLDHLFLDCELARTAWIWLFQHFDCSWQPFSSFNELFQECMNFSFSSQVARLWKIGVLNLIWAIWNLRNCCCFEDIKPSMEFLIAHLRVSFLEVSSAKGKIGFMDNKVSDLLILRGIRVTGRAAPSRTYMLVSWYPPPPGWIKINTDGTALGSPGNLSCGTVFRDCLGQVVVCSHDKLGFDYAFEAEMAAAVRALELARERRLAFIWLEFDSMYVVAVLSTLSLRVPWRLLARWRILVDYLRGIQFRVSHIYREGNKVADCMANPDRDIGIWSFSIPCILSLIHADLMGTGVCRISS